MTEKPKLKLAQFKQQPQANPEDIRRQAEEYSERLRAQGYNVSVKAPLIVIRKGKKDVRD